MYSRFESFYKLGITCLNKKGEPRRFRDYKRLGYKIELLKLVKFENYIECHDKELKLKQLIKNNLYCPMN